MPRSQHTGQTTAAPDDDPAPGDARPADAPNGAADRSLVDDLGALIDDGRTYAEAELAYQKTRLAFVAERGKGGLGFVLGALGLIHLTLVALVVGSLIALIPVLGPWGAMLAVVGALLVVTALLLFAARGRFGEIAAAFREDRS